MSTAAAIAHSETHHTMQEIFHRLHLKASNPGAIGAGWAQESGGQPLASVNPTDAHSLADVNCCTEESYERLMKDASRAFHKWRMVPAPVRGDIVRQIGDAFREYKEPLGKLISLEMGKIYSEGLGEVQEAIDICDFAVGLSRQLYGLTMHSERPGHRMYEQWHPLGIVGVITAFNFPCAVAMWNAAIAMVCGNTVLWKPSEKTPLITVAMTKIICAILEKNSHGGVFNMCISGDKSLGETMAQDKRIALVSATGSVPMGRHVGTVVAERMGKSLLELGGNNAIIVMDDADMELATRAIAFGAVGTAGQRCTTTRRVFVHEGIENQLVEKLERIYKSIRMGDPLKEGVLMGPLIDKMAVEAMLKGLETIEEQGGEILCGGKAVNGNGFFVEPTLVLCKQPIEMMQEEIFAPILYICPFTKLDEAITMQNNVPQGLSSAIFTQSMKHAEKFLSHAGSDCGIANVNIGTSGAEIGGAFGGEKETGGGRESGSDAWKAYMRRQTCTLNWSDELPLAQGVEFL